MPAISATVSPARLDVAECMSEPLSSAATDQLAFNEAVAALADYSLAKRTPVGLQLHRLVQAEYVPRSSPAAVFMQVKQVHGPVLKIAVGRESHRGFESHTLRS
jgi:hypothetical protein